MRPLSFLLLFVVLWFPPSLFAEIVQCGSVWTNGECEAEAGRRIKEVSNPPKPVDPERAGKMLLLDELRRSQREAEEQYKIDLSLNYVEHVCFELDSSLERCREEAERFETRLSQKIAVKQKQLNLEEKSHKTSKPVSRVIVVQQNERYVPYRRKTPKHKPISATGKTISGAAARDLAARILKEEEDPSGKNSHDRPASNSRRAPSWKGGKQ